MYLYISMLHLFFLSPIFCLADLWNKIIDRNMWSVRNETSSSWIHIAIYNHLHVACFLRVQILCRSFFKCWVFLKLLSLWNIVFWLIDWLIDWQVVLPCRWWQLPEHWSASAAPTEVQPHRELVPGEAQSQSSTGNTEQK